MIIWMQNYNEASMVVEYIIWHATIWIHGFLFVEIHLLLLCFCFKISKRNLSWIVWSLVNYFISHGLGTYIVYF
jgi:hypothetical protein